MELHAIKAVKYLNKVISSIPVLTRDDVTACSDKEKADMISEYFITCLNENIPPLGSGVSPDPDNVYDLDEEFLCTTDEIFYALTFLDTSKSSKDLSTHA